jgi:hypothetical protein
MTELPHSRSPARCGDADGGGCSPAGCPPPFSFRRWSDSDGKTWNSLCKSPSYYLFQWAVPRSPPRGATPRLCSTRAFPIERAPSAVMANVNVTPDGSEKIRTGWAVNVAVVTIQSITGRWASPPIEPGFGDLSIDRATAHASIPRARYAASAGVIAFVSGGAPDSMSINSTWPS